MEMDTPHIWLRGALGFNQQPAVYQTISTSNLLPIHPDKHPTCSSSNLVYIKHAPHSTCSSSYLLSIQHNIHPTCSSSNLKCIQPAPHPTCSSSKLIYIQPAPHPIWCTSNLLLIQPLHMPTKAIMKHLSINQLVPSGILFPVRALLNQGRHDNTCMKISQGFFSFSFSSRSAPRNPQEQLGRPSGLILSARGGAAGESGSTLRSCQVTELLTRCPGNMLSHPYEGNSFSWSHS